MIRLAADENLDNDILRGICRRVPSLDVVRVQDVGLRGADDARILAWAAIEGRVLVTHDVSTVTPAARARVASGLPMPGVVQVVRTSAIGAAIEDLVLLVECSRDEEWANQVRYVPL